MRWFFCLGLLGALALGSACGSGSGSADACVGAGCTGGPPDACVGIGCMQVNCTGGTTTSLSGTVFAPNGTLPLYNVTVYVPLSAVAPFPDGAGCDQCAAELSGSPLVQTTTDTQGRFLLQDVPADVDVPVVIQVGKWRRQFVVPQVASCVDTPLDAGQTRLPRNKDEGDIPKMALTTGGADALECLIRKVGLDDAEITPDGGNGRLHLYAGEGGADSIAGAGGLTNAEQLWGDVASLSRYDIVFTSCEGGQNPGTKPPSALQAMYDYTSIGGRVFASHWHNYWLEAGPDPFPQVATFNHQADLNDITADIDQSLDRGMALAEWLVNVGGSTTLGKIDLTATQHTVEAVNDTLSDRWIYLDNTANGTPSVQYFSFTTPLTAPEDMRCGKFVFSDIHVSSGDSSDPGTNFPNGCTSGMGMSPQEKVLAFMIFDIASCVGPPIGAPAPAE